MIPRLLVANESSSFEEVIEQYIIEHPSTHNSIYKILPEAGKSIAIEQVRQLKKELLISSTNRLVIIYDFQTAKTEAQNALLKTLEDQTENNQFILCTNHIGAILPTIISRCAVELLSRDDNAEQLDLQMEQSVENLLKGNSFEFLNNELFQATSIDDAKHIFNLILHVLQKRVRTGDKKAALLASHALEFASLLRTNNLNPQLSIDSWCLLAKKMVL